ncbi:SMP-30/gluconolactonase/LRE family protein [Acidimangrovimonas pyrenivorans]|uniref:SMP-30/gluconolactonase/LRE family protein n=1 Tax=Acidimangrovimonas pyrenivorans TaxID=2030798 RepID=A0ABV7AKG5_9RHOB
MTDTMQAEVFDRTECALGEGPLWHPERGQVFWFDILGKRLCTRDGDATRHWQFDDHVSAAGWIDRDSLLIASERALLRFDIGTGAQEHVCDLEADNPVTRSNDGRADPHGGFWIGTMGKRTEPGAGAIWRWYRGELRRLFAPITVSNAICFAPDGRHACFADSPKRQVLRVALDGDGWPVGEPEVLVDLTGHKRVPDGAVMDADGVLWLAEWRGSRVAAYGPDGRLLREVTVPAPQVTCPAFGGPDLTTLYITTARDGLEPGKLAQYPQSGMTFTAEVGVKGQVEHRVVL